MTILRLDQVATLLRDVGLTGETLVKLTAAAPAESGGRDKDGRPFADSSAEGDTTITTAKWGPSIGFLQVRSLQPGRAELQSEPFRDQAFLRGSPQNQAKAVKAVFDRQGFGAWSVITGGQFRQYLDEARQTIANLGDNGVPVDGRVEVGPTGPPPTGSLIIGGRIIQPSQLKVSGESLFADIDAVRVSLSRDIDEADRLIVEVADPKRTLLRNSLLQEKSTVTLDGVVFELTDIDKNGPTLTVTFTDAAAVDLNRPVSEIVTQTPGVATRGDFMRRLVGLVPWVQADIEPGLTTLEPLALGTSGQPDETPWQALGRLARDVNWRRCAVGNRVLIGSDAWLAGRREPLPIAEFTAGVDDIDFRSNFGVPVDEATVRCDSAVWSAPPSTAVTLSGVGFADGEWLVARFDRESLASTRAVVTLVRARPALNEPSPPPDVRDDRQAEPDLGEGVDYGSPAGNVVQGPTSQFGLSWPLTGRVSSEFGPRARPGGVGSSNHAGIDIAVPVGTQIRAALDGVVEFVGLSGGYGLLIRIRHDSSLGPLRVATQGRAFSTRYAHCNSAQVRPGQQVQRGEQIALSGGAPGTATAGNSQGPHLHFETRVGDGAVNPRLFLP